MGKGCFRLAVAQFRPLTGRVKANAEKMVSLMEKLRREQRADLVVFPELALTGYEAGEEFAALAERPGEGPGTSLLCRAAGALAMYVVAGYAERGGRPGEIYDSALLIDDRGTVRGNFRKVHLLDTERRYFMPGASYPVFETGLGRVGILICWDAAFPEAARCLALQGADFLAVPASWERPYRPQWELTIAARALDNGLPVAGANRVGPDRTLDFFGASLVAGPLGVPLAVCGEDEEAKAVPLDHGETARARTLFATQLKDRRPETYGLVTEKVNEINP